MAVGFEPAPMNGGGNVVRNFPTPDRDPLGWLPPRPADKLQALRQHTGDCSSLMPSSEEMQALRTDRQREQAHLDRLTKHASVGGFSLPDTDSRVIASRKKIDALTKEIGRLQAIYDERAGRWQKSGHTLRAVEDYLQSGIPGGCGVVEVADIEVASVLKRGETAIVGLDRLRRRQRELKADLHRIRSSQFPKSETKPLARQWVEAQAQAGEPSVSGLVEHLQGGVMLADRRITAMVYNVDSAPAAAAIFTDPNAIGLIAWLLKDQLIAKLEAAIDAETDDDATLSTAERQVKEAEIASAHLDTERQESALIWQLASEGSAIWHRADCNALAILGLALETSTRPLPSGSSPGHSFEIAEGRLPAGRTVAASPFAPGQRPEWKP